MAILSTYAREVTFNTPRSVHRSVVPYRGMFRFKKESRDAVSRTENRTRATVCVRQLRILHSPTGKARSIRRSYRPGTRRFLSPRLHTGEREKEKTADTSASLTRNVRKCFGTYAIETHWSDRETINTSRAWFGCFPEPLANNRCTRWLATSSLNTS